MDIKKVEIKTLITDPSNVRKHSDKNIMAIKGSLARFGQQKPIVVNSKNIVIAGNGTLEAAISLGWEEIYIVCSELSGVDLTAYAIADNRTAELATWDDDGLKKTLSALADLDFDLSSIGFDDDFMSDNDAVDKSNTVTDDDLSEHQKINIKKAWDDLINHWYCDIERNLKNDQYVFQDVNKLTYKINFLNFIYLNKEFERYNSHAYHPHQITLSGDGNNGSVCDLFKETSYDNNLSDRVRFVTQNKPNFNKIKNLGSVPMAGKKFPADFPAVLAKELINEFCLNNGSVLDPCHGWGGRLIGFMASHAKKYTGIDCSPMTSRGVKNIANDLNKYVDKEIQLECSKFEEFESDSQFNFCLTSPPYFDREQYEGDEQSYKLHNNYDSWRDGFYCELITKVYKLLIEGSYFCLQVGSQKYPLLEDGKKIAKNVGFKIKEIRKTEMTSMKSEFNDSDISGEVILVLQK